MFRGDKSAYPVYLTIANLSKEVRRRPSAHANVLIGYLPTSKLECFKGKKKKTVAGYNLFHRCMRCIVNPLVRAGSDGVRMTCPDGNARLVFPILAAYVADYPEQCKVVCIDQKRCPRCFVATKKMGDYPIPVQNLWRDPEFTKAALQNHEEGGRSKTFKDLHLKPVYRPFWENLPHCNIFRCITPDILHEGHKFFWDHLVAWCANIIGKEELDARFKVPPPFARLKHFKIGVSPVSQWTGSEFKRMQKLFLGLLAYATDEKIVRGVRGVLEFLYLAQLHRHNKHTLVMLDESWATFHALKQAFVEQGGRLSAQFLIPKLHKLMHYRDAIQQLGSLDGFNSEATERLHINYAKMAYRASNRRDHVIQMTRWLTRQEAVDRHSLYLEWESKRAGEKAKVEPPRFDETDGAGDQDGDDELREAARIVQVAQEKAPSNKAIVRHHVANISRNRRVPLMKLVNDHGAVEFLPALQRFMGERCPEVDLPTKDDSFDLYPNLYIVRPLNAYIKGDPQPDRIRCVAKIPAKGRKPETPAQFDIGLVALDTRTKHSVGLDGLRAARVRVIFDLPPRCNLDIGKCAYVKWYTPFTSKHAASGMFKIQRSTQMGRPNAEIIPVTLIERAAHLLPCMRKEVDRSWKSDTVLDTASEFLFNWWITIDLWTMCVLPRITVGAKGDDTGGEPDGDGNPAANPSSEWKGKGTTRKRSAPI
jgi:hypothetical protein